MTANAMNNNTFPNTRAGSIRRWAAGAIVGSLFVVGFVLGLAFPSMVGVTTDDSSLRGTSNARAQPAAAATIAAPVRLACLDVYLCPVLTGMFALCTEI